MAWIAERKDLLSAFFVLLTVVLWIRHRRRPRSGRLVAALVAFTLALRAKPMAVTLPLVLLVLDWWPLGRLLDRERGAGSPRRPLWSIPWFRHHAVVALVVEKLPLLALAAGAAAMTLIAQSRGGAVVSLVDHSLGQRLANASVSLAAYLVKALWPTGLSIWYAWPEGSHRAATILAASLLLTLLTGAAIRLRRRQPALLCGWCWYLVMLLPVIGLVQIGGQSMADRYTYLPLVGVAGGLAWAIPRPGTRRGAACAAALAGSALLLLSLATRGQIDRWRDSETLLRHALASAGESWMVRNALGHALLAQGRPAEAAEQFEAAIAQTPDVESYVALGKALIDLGDATGALAQFERALWLQPGHRTARFNRATALQALGRAAEAEEAYREALRRGQALPGTYGNLANLIARQGRIEEAAALCREGIRVFPDSGELWNNLGIFEGQRGAPEEAVEAFTRAVQLRPEWVTARENLELARNQLSGPR